MSKRKTYAKRIAHAVRGGLRLQGSRRALWWRQQWITYLESLHMGARLGRGRNYAQSGQVLWLEVSPGKIEAEVQGASEAPYRITITMPTLPDNLVTLSEKSHIHSPIIALTDVAQVYTRHLPMSLEAALERAGYSLFPHRREDLRMQCNCRDWARPCKHLAAVLYLFIDAVATEPLHLLRFRGIPLPDAQFHPQPKVASAHALPAPQPLTSHRSPFTRYGNMPYWRGEEELQKVLTPAYDRARQSAVAALENLSANFRFLDD